MHVTRYPTAEALLAAVGDYLVEREAEHNLQLGILATLRDLPGVYEQPPYLATVTDDDSIALVAVRTPPHGPVLSEAGVGEDRLPGAIAALVDDLRVASPDLPTVLGPQRTVESFVRRWSAATGDRAHLEMAERIYRLERVIPAPSTPGRWRLAGEGDRDRLRDWAIAFHEESLPAGSPRVETDRLIDRWVRGDDRYAYLWEIDGRVVSLVVAGARTPNGRRIGPVYTPPGERGRGYASALTAAASQDQLDHGHRFCFLFTDLANPTSNRLYQRIGYEPIADVDQYRFERSFR